MMLGLVGRKCGMTRIFTEEGVSIPVSVIEVQPNRVTQMKTVETDGYQAIQITTGQKRASRVKKPMEGLFSKANVEAGRGLWEFCLKDSETMDVGHELNVEMFTPGQKVDVTGTTIGKGFAGVIKRHHFHTQDATHGNSLSHRAVGSTGQNQTPGRVFKGKKMSGHLGNSRRTTQNLEIVRVDVEKNLLLVKGAIPGAKGSDVMIRPAMKTKGA